MSIEEYVCRRLLQVECGFPPVYNESLEIYFKELEDEFNFCKDRLDVYRSRIPMAKDFLELNEDFIALLRGVLRRERKQNIGNMAVDATSAYKVLVVTRYFIQHYKSHNKGDFAIALCFWARNFLKQCDIQWDQPRSTYFYIRRTRIAQWNNVLYSFFSWGPFTIVDKLFKLYYRFLSRT